MSHVPLRKSVGGTMCDAQGNKLREQGTREVFLRLPGGRIAKLAFRVASVKIPILSLGRLAREGFEFSLRGGSCTISKGDTGFALELYRNSMWLKAEAFGTMDEARCISSAPVAG
jgi:hypothetical protein